MKIRKTHKKALIALAIGGFGIGMTEFVIMGILPDVANSLKITIPQAGHFIAAYALGVVIGAPLLTSLGNKLPANKMLLGLMIWFTIFNTLSAFATSYSSLLLFRFLSGLPHGAFFGIGAVVAGKLAAPGKSASAIATMFAGLTIANVIGVPLSTYLGHEFSWKISFLLVGIVGIAALLSVYFWMPMFPKTPQSNIKKDFQIFKKAELWVLILLTTIGTGGFFAWYSYIAPLLTNIIGYPESMVGYAMILAGLGMVVGNFLGAKMAEKLKPLNAVVLSLGMMVLALLANTIVATHPIGILVLTFIIGIISFTVATPIQMAIIKASEGSEMLGSSMNQSAFNMGNASGAYLAGIPIAMGFEITAASYVGAALAGMGILIALGIIVNKNSDDIKIKIRRLALK
ncbi:MFS transporter [Cellulophaga tyrosinoxydans]|uniref:MFS transporter, DHA1 family, arabinose polymer transporter n=1 Tax=Cellulophaga tyrosinoxydans TaxID=504486 RepID=A0A1W1ZQP1_9FLAO|nr:MFS transporter [Cellulophaga tyrosinoxydans]SMC50714.1 MFS transporter, DHA1 family, arabinose polymer transporter [Cellulophaga tyrosinoxydans]